MGRSRPQWTDDIYEAAISAVSDKIARLSHHYPRTPDQIALAQAAEVLRYERRLLDRRAQRARTTKEQP